MIYFYLITSTLISLSYSAFITLKFFEIMYPAEYEIIKYKFGWYSLKLVTISTIIFNKCKGTVYDNFLSMPDNYKVTFIKDGNEIVDYVVNDLTCIPKFEEEFDIIVYEKNKTIFFSDKLITDNNFKSLKESNFKFLAPQLHLLNKTIPISFLDYSIYLSTNQLFWFGFAKWYVSSDFCTEKFDLDEEDEYFTISFIDNNMNTIKIKHNEHVILGESDYFIIECIEKDPEFEDTETADVEKFETEPEYRCNVSGPM